MAKTNAQRQQEYRARRALANRFGDSRLNLWVDGRASKALKRLAAHHGISQRAMLERLLLTADTAVQAEIMPGSSAWQRYFRAGYGEAGGDVPQTMAADPPTTEASGGTDQPE